MDVLVASFQSFYPLDPAIVIATQNPEPSTYGHGLYSRLHNERQAFTVGYAESRRWACFDRYQGYVDAGNPSGYFVGPDNVHPSGQGYAFEKLMAWDCVMDGTGTVVSGLPN